MSIETRINRLVKDTGVEKSRWTVPLMSQLNGGGGVIDRKLVNTTIFSCRLLKPQHYFPLSYQNRFTANKAKKRELTIDEKDNIQAWTESGMSTPEIASNLGPGATPKLSY
jgi:hypothetical protein